MRMSSFRDYWLNRTACSILEDMRNCDKTKNYSNLASLIEELQVAANRMESGLDDKRDLLAMQEEWHKWRKKLKKIRKKAKAAKIKDK